MKHLLLFCFLAISPIILISQTKQEIKLDAISFLYRGVAIGYEVSLSEKSAFQTDIKYSNTNVSGGTIRDLENSKSLRINQSYLTIRTMWKTYPLSLGKERFYSGIFLEGNIFLGESEADIAAFQEEFQRKPTTDTRGNWGVGIPIGVKLNLLDDKIVLEPEFAQSILFSRNSVSQRQEVIFQSIPRIHLGVRF